MECDQRTAEVVETLSSQGVEMAYLFGSRSRATESEVSDWDIAIRFKERPSSIQLLVKRAQIQSDLEAILHAPVDLVALEDAGPTLLYEAVWKGRCLLFPGDENQRIQYEMKVRRRFEDYQHMQRFYDRAREERLGITA